MPRIELVVGDITAERVDAIVNAANSSLLGGGGVDGAIHRAGGPAILEECRALRATTLRAGLPTGAAVATGAGGLDARWVIHTVGPVWPGPGPGPESDARRRLLVAAYRNALGVASSLGAASVAFPAISAGVYGWPADDAALVALGTTAEASEAPALVRFVLSSERMHDEFRTAADRLGVETF